MTDYTEYMKSEAWQIKRVEKLEDRPRSKRRPYCSLFDTSSRTHRSHAKRGGDLEKESRRYINYLIERRRTRPKRVSKAERSRIKKDRSLL